MGLRWYIGNFSDGVITGELPGVVRDASITRDVMGDDVADLQIVWAQLSTSQKNNWKKFFAPVERFVVLVDEDRAWDHRHAILFAGFINKVENPIGGGTFKIRATGLNEYLAARYMLPKADTITNSESKSTFQAGTYSGLLSRIVNRCFSPTDIPSNSPLPPQVLGDTPSYDINDDAVKYEHTWAEVKTYDEVLADLCARFRREVWFVPRWRTAGLNEIVWDVKVVNPATAPIPVVHYLNSTTKLSAAGSYIDSTDMFSRIWVKAENKSDEKKIILKPVGLPKPDSIDVLLERYEDFGVPLTEADLTSRAMEYMEVEGHKIPDTFSATYEEVSVRGSMVDFLGDFIRYVGVAGTISAGIDVTMRVVSIQFSPRKQSVTLTLQEPQIYYKRLPRPGNMNKDKKKKGGGSGTKTPGTKSPGITPTPPNPWEPGPRPPESTVFGQWGFGSGPIDEFPMLHNTKVKTSSVPGSSSTGIPSTASWCQESNLFWAVDVDATMTISYSALPDASRPTTIGYTAVDSIANHTVQSGYVTGNGTINSLSIIFQGSILSASIQNQLIDIINPRLIGSAGGRRIESVIFHMYSSKTIAVGGTLLIPVQVVVRWRGKWGNDGYDWFVERYIVFVQVKYNSYTGLESFGVLSNTYCDLNINLQANYNGVYPMSTANFGLNRVGEAQVIINSSGTAYVLDIRPFSTGSGAVNGPENQWLVPALPPPTTGVNLFSSLSFSYGMVEIPEEGHKMALYVLGRRPQPSTSVGEYVLACHPVVLESLIPDYSKSWIIRDTFTHPSYPPGASTNLSTTWYGRAVFPWWGSYPTNIIVWNGLGTSISEIAVSMVYSGVGSSYNPGGIITWKDYIFYRDGAVRLVEWDI